MRISDWSSDVCSSDLPLMNVCIGSNQRIIGGPILVESIRQQERCDRPNSPFELLGCSPLCRSTGRSYAGYCKRWCRENRSEEHTSELQSLMRKSYAVFCLQKTLSQNIDTHNTQ